MSSVNMKVIAFRITSVCHNNNDKASSDYTDRKYFNVWLACKMVIWPMITEAGFPDSDWTWTSRWSEKCQFFWWLEAMGTPQVSSWSPVAGNKAKLLWSVLYCFVLWWFLLLISESVNQYQYVIMQVINQSAGMSLWFTNYGLANKCTVNTYQIGIIFNVFAYAFVDQSSVSFAIVCA